VFYEYKHVKKRFNYVSLVYIVYLTEHCEYNKRA